MSAVSKVQQQKEKQGYTDKLIPGVCGNCYFFKSDMIPNEWDYVQEKNMRCGIGGFKVKKNGSCAEHRFADGVA